MDEKLFLRIKFSVDDYIRVLTFMRSQLFINKYGFIITPAIIFLTVALFIFILANDKNNINCLGLIAASFLPSFVVGAVIYSLDKFLTPFLMKLSISKQIKSSPILGEEDNIVISNEGFEISNDLVDSKIKWEAIIKALESETDFVFYTTNKFGTFFPKNAFASETDVNFLRCLSRAKLGDKAKF